MQSQTLRGALKTIKKHRPRLRFAGWYVRNGKSVASVCKPLLEELGYHVLINHNNGVMACAMEKLPSVGLNRVFLFTDQKMIIASM